MLKCWTLHNQYRQFIFDGLDSLSESDRLRLQGSYQNSLNKLLMLDLDLLLDVLRPYYSSTGRPAILQPEIFRSLMLMVDCGFTSIKKWHACLRSDSLLAFLIGCTVNQLPSLGSYYDFINRLWLRNSALERNALKHLYRYNFNRKPKKGKLKRGQKLPVRKPGVIKQVALAAKSNHSFASFERLLQEVFVQLAVIPSTECGLIDSSALTVAGDGTCLPVSSSSYGIKTCTCKADGNWNCKCNRRFSDPDARWGWDSSKEIWFYGHTIYLLSCYCKQYHTDLPLYFRILNANRHDGVSGVVALAEYRELCPDLPIKNIVLDSAHDNYPTYELCNEWNMIPFIDLNPSNNGNLTYPGAVAVNEKGHPICAGGHPMVNWGFCKDKNSRKWRCALACGKIKECSCKAECSPSEYGRVIYTKTSDDPRIFTPVPRGTKAFKDMFKTRTCSERINTRILNDYHVEYMKIRGKKRYSFFTMLACIQIHLDARQKKEHIQKTA